MTRSLSRPEFLSARNVGIGMVVTLLGLFMLGLPVGILPGVAFVLFLTSPSQISRSSALSALVLLAIAAGASLLEGSLDPGDLNLRYAPQRELAATAGAASGGLLAVSAVTGAILERNPNPPPARGRRRAQMTWPPLATTAVLIVAAALRLLVAPAEALGPDATRAHTNLVNGVDLTTGIDAGVLVPPVPLLVTTAAPALPRLVLVAVGVLTVLVVLRLCRSLASPDAGARAGVAGGLVAALLPDLWGQQLPEALATLAVTGAVALVVGERSPRRVLGCGTLLALGSLAEPTVVLALPLVMLWLVRHRERRGARRSSPGGTALGAARAAALTAVPMVLMLVPVARWTLTSLGAVWPRSPGDAVTLGQPLGLPGAALAAAVCGLALTGTVPALRRHRLLLGVLPVVAATSGWITESARGLLGWGAGLAAAGAGLAVTGVALNLVQRRRRVAEPDRGGGQTERVGP